MTSPAPFQSAAERLAAGVILCLSTGAFFPLLRGAEAVDPQGGDPLQKATWMGLSLVILALASLRLPAVARAASRTPELLLLVVYVCASTVWSAVPEITLRRSVGLAFTTLFGIWLAVRFPDDQLVRLVVHSLGLTAVASIVVSILAPAIGVSSGFSEGAWRGVFGLKNELGRTMALLALAALALAKAAKRGRWRRVALAAVAVGVILLADSMTALVIVVAAVTVSEALRVLRLRYSLAIAGTIIVGLTLAAAVYALVNYRGLVVDSMGRDLTFTGRTVLWAMVIEQIAQRPWGGYGYGAFWLGFEGPSAPIWRTLHWHPPTAHNGYLDLALAVGLVGVAVFAVGLVLAVSRAIRATIQGHPAATWHVMVLVFILLYNLSENAVLRYNHVTWILYVAMVSSLARAARAQRQPPAAAPPRGRPLRGRAPRHRVPSPAGAAAGLPRVQPSRADP